MAQTVFSGDFASQQTLLDNIIKKNDDAGAKNPILAWMKEKKWTFLPLKRQPVRQNRAKISSKTLFDGTNRYYKSVQFIHCSKMYNIIYNSPFSNSSSNDLALVEGQTKSIKLF